MRLRATLNIGGPGSPEEQLRVPGIVAAMSPQARVSLLVAAAATQPPASPSPRRRSRAPSFPPSPWRRRRAAFRRSCSTSECAPIRRRARSAEPLRCTSATGARGRGGCSSGTARWRRGWEPRSQPGRTASSAAEPRPRQSRSGAAQLALGLGQFWQGQTADAQRSWRRAAAEPDSTYAVRADDFLHPELPVPGLPAFVPSFASPAPAGAAEPARAVRVPAPACREGQGPRRPALRCCAATPRPPALRPP